MTTVPTVASCPDCGPEYPGLRSAGPLGLLAACETCGGSGWVEGLVLSRVLAPSSAPVRRWAQLYRAAA